MTYLSRFLALLAGICLLIVTVHSQSCAPCSPRLKITSETISELYSQWILEPIILSMAFNQNSDKLYYVSTSPADAVNPQRRVSLVEPIESEFDISWNFNSESAPPFENLSERKWIDIASHPTKALIAIGSEEGVLEIWNLETASSTLSLLLDDAPITDLIFHPKGEWVAAIIQAKIAIVYLDDASIRWLSLPEGTTSTDNLSVSPNSQWLATYANSQLIIWETNTFTPIFFDVESEPLAQVLFLPQSDYLVTIATRSIRLWMLTNSTIELVRAFNIPQLDVEGTITDTALNADGSVLVVLYNRLKVVVWNVKTGDVIAVPTIDTFQRENNPDYINTLAFSPDGYWLLYGTDYGLQSFIIP